MPLEIGSESLEKWNREDDREPVMPETGNFRDAADGNAAPVKKPAEGEALYRKWRRTLNDQGGRRGAKTPPAPPTRLVDGDALHQRWCETTGDGAKTPEVVMRRLVESGVIDEKGGTTVNEMTAIGITRQQTRGVRRRQEKQKQRG